MYISRRRGAFGALLGILTGFLATARRANKPPDPSPTPNRTRRGSRHGHEHSWHSASGIQSDHRRPRGDRRDRRADDAEIWPASPPLPGSAPPPRAASASFDNSGTFAPSIHGLGASSSNGTLVLIDGHRLPLTGINHTLADPSIIAPLTIERVEVLPDGASSTYGSDAVAGVINFITRRKL